MRSIALDTQVCALLPPWYREILDYQQLCRTEQAQFELLARELNAVADNFFFQTMDEDTVAAWEQVFSIVPDPATETLAFRRARVQSRVSTRPPFTLGFLGQKLDELIGPGEWTASVDYPNYTLYIESAAQNQSYATEVAFTVNQIKPAHIVYVNTPYVRTGLLLSETVSAAQRIYNYHLGSWGLGVSPFASEREQGVVKMPETPSVRPALLEGAAAFVAGDIAAARINGAKTITALDKSLSGSTLTVTYTVAQSVADAITQAELLDAAGSVLTASAVYVPVSGATVMKHIIPVSEGVNTNG